MRQLPGVLAACARVTALGAALVLAAASSSPRDAHGPAAPYQSQHGSSDGAPAPVPMNPDNAVGLWHSSFGAVKLEYDDQRQDHLLGVWIYDRQGQEIVGYIEGPLSGNVLSFAWEEPSEQGRPPLRGRGYLVFDPEGTRFTGRWWSESRDRGGEWNGWRDSPSLGRTGAEPGPARDDGYDDEDGDGDGELAPNPYGGDDDPSADPYR